MRQGGSTVSFGDTGSTVVLPGTVAVTAGVAVLPVVGVAIETLDDEEGPPDLEDDAAVSAGVTARRARRG